MRCCNRDLSLSGGSNPIKRPVTPPEAGLQVQQGVPEKLAEIAVVIESGDYTYLRRYNDDRRIWFVVVDRNLSLQEFAWDCLNSPETAMKHFLAGAVECTHKLLSCRGEYFHCIALKDVCLLKAMQRKPPSWVGSALKTPQALIILECLFLSYSPPPLSPSPVAIAAEKDLDV